MKETFFRVFFNPGFCKIIVSISFCFTLILISQESSTPKSPKADKSKSKTLSLEEMLKFALTESTQVQIGVNTSMQKKAVYEYQRGLQGFHLTGQVRTGYEQDFRPGAESDPFASFNFVATYGLLNFSNTFSTSESEGDAYLELANTVQREYGVARQIILRYSKILNLKAQLESVQEGIQKHDRLRGMLRRAKSEGLTNIDILAAVEESAIGTARRLFTIQSELNHEKTHLLILSGYGDINNIDIDIDIDVVDLDVARLANDKVFDTLKADSNSLIQNTRLVKSLKKAAELYDSQFRQTGNTYLPDVGIFAEAGKRASFNDIGGTDGMVASGGISLRYAFFDGDRTKNQRKVLLLRQNQARLMLDKILAEHRLLSDYVTKIALPKLDEYKSLPPEVIRRKKQMDALLPRANASLANWLEYSNAINRHIAALSEYLRVKYIILGELMYLRYVLAGES